MRAALFSEWVKARTVPDLAVAFVLATACVLATGGELGIQVTQAVVAVAGVHLLAGEYSTGLIRATLLASPRRRHVLAAKAVLLTTGTALAAAPGTDVAATVYLCLIALLSLGTAALVRNGTAAAGLVLALLYVLPAMPRWMPDPDWARRVHRAAPSTIDLDDPVRGLAVTAVWTACALLLGTVALTRFPQPSSAA